jgi:hypothetical protein
LPLAYNRGREAQIFQDTRNHLSDRADLELDEAQARGQRFGEQEALFAAVQKAWNEIQKFRE